MRTGRRTLRWALLGLVAAAALVLAASSRAVTDWLWFAELGYPVFPGTFKPLSEMPRAVRDHVRYPEDLFRLQASILTRYHMTNPQVFYNQEDVWELPRELYESAEVDMEPYYVITRFGLIRRAAAIFEEARRLAGSGDWPGYGRALEQLGAVLEQLSDAARTP